jgi:hypothetical protein
MRFGISGSQTPEFDFLQNSTAQAESVRGKRAIRNPGPDCSAHRSTYSACL